MTLVTPAQCSGPPLDHDRSRAEPLGRRWPRLAACVRGLPAGAVLSLIARPSIGARIFRSFLTMLLLIGLLGGYGLYVLSAAGDIVARTYDGPLMAINFARAASLDFAHLDKAMLLRRVVPEQERDALDDRINELSETFTADLGVAEQRSLSGDERATVAKIRGSFDEWTEKRLKGERADTVSAKISDLFETLVELTADHSFVARRKAIWSIAYFKTTSLVALLAACAVAIAMSWMLSRRIVRPLAAAARVADRIAGGELQTPIPAGGPDETGTLLRSMTVMQDNIRLALEREQRQRRSAQGRLVDALEGSREGMVLVDSDGLIAISNSRIASFFPASAAQLVPGADFAAATEAIWRREPAQETEGEFALEDGRWLRFSQTATEDGGVFLFFSDITDRRMREESYRIAKQAAEDASMAKSNFLATMTHELRTPLNAIIGFSEIIAGQMMGEVGVPTYVEYAGDIVRSGRNLLTMINGVLDLSRVQSGTLTLNPELQDAQDLIEYCVNQISPSAEAGKVSLDVVVPEQPMTIYGELGKLRQIVLNLLSNAVKFTPAGGAVSLRATDRDGRVKICVVDTGIGMTPEEIPIALAPFGQVDSSLTRKYEGAGLGLPLAAAFAHLHGASLTIDSAPGGGTSVSVAFPPVEPLADSMAA